MSQSGKEIYGFWKIAAFQASLEPVECCPWLRGTS